MRAPPESLRPIDRRAHLHRQVHDLDDLGGVGLRERAAEDGEVLREGVGEAAVDAAVAGDDAVAGHDLLGHAEVAAAVGDELVDLLEGAGVEQQLDALARGQLAGVALPAQPLLAAAQLGPALKVVSSESDKSIRPWPPAPSPSPSGTSRGRCR